MCELMRQRSRCTKGPLWTFCAPTGTMYLSPWMQPACTSCLSSWYGHFSPPLTFSHRSLVQTLGIRSYQKHFVIHRDLKMLNVMVDKNGDVKIIDFGLAFMRSVDDPSELRTKFPGTAAFAAPEVLMHEDYDAEVDVWAMGIILYLMGTG